MVEIGEPRNDRSVVTLEGFQLFLDVPLAPGTPAGMTLSQSRTLGRPKWVKELWQLIPRGNTHITGGCALLPFLQQLQSQVIGWMKSGVERRKLLVANLAIEQNHVAKNLVHGMNCPQTALL